MTREKAIEILNSKIWPGFNGNSLSGEWLDVFIALGMLKLDEPKSASDLAIQYLAGRCRMPSSHEGECNLFSKKDAERIVELIDHYGLRIVSK